jgi:hypothetical protein
MTLAGWEGRARRRKRPAAPGRPRQPGLIDRYVRHLMPADVIAIMRDRDWGERP